MPKPTLSKYLVDQGAMDATFYDTLKYVLDSHIYYYGSHFTSPIDKHVQDSFRRKLRKQLKKLYYYYLFSRQKKNETGHKILSNAYFNLNSELKLLGLDVITPSWAPLKSNQTLFGDFSFFKAAEQINNHLQCASFNFLTSSEFKGELDCFTIKFTEKIAEENIRALAVPNDVSFYENLSIKVFRMLKRPSFVFLHGLPGRYNIIDENRSDFLVVWGEKIKQHYVNYGFDANKILISGHPSYQNLNVQEIRSGLKDILVLAKTGVGTPHSDGMVLFDRGDQIVYLLQIQQSLRKLGVSKVRLRFHPSVNPSWHYQFLDKSFFHPDDQPLGVSLEQASLVIGPTSTVLLESVFAGVNYIVFEPSLNGFGLLNDKLVPPFDGSDPNVPVATNTDMLEKLIKDNRKVKVDLFHDYIRTPFNISFINELL